MTSKCNDNQMLRARQGSREGGRTVGMMGRAAEESASQAAKQTARQLRERPAGRKREVAGCNGSRQLEC